MAKKILVIDDEVDILKLLKDYFELQGYLVYTASSGSEGLNQIAKKPDIILLDINMPGMDGFEVCRKIRDFISCPILFLTAKVEQQDVVNGLTIGGDDYILKPFHIEELGARVAAHLRRDNRTPQKSELKFTNRFVINYRERCMLYEDQLIHLTKTEFDLIKFLSMHKGQVFGKEAIYERIWGYDCDGDSSIIMEHIRRIRTKLGRYSDIPLIETVWGVGYKWIG